MIALEQTKTPLSKSLKDGNDPRYHLGWGAKPPLCRRRPHSRERARPDDGGLNRPALPTSTLQRSNVLTLAGFGGDSGGAFGACRPSSLHSPRLAGCLARRVLLHRRRRWIFSCCRNCSTVYGGCQSPNYAVALSAGCLEDFQPSKKICFRTATDGEAAQTGGYKDISGRLHLPEPFLGAHQDAGLMF